MKKIELNNKMLKKLWKPKIAMKFRFWMLKWTNIEQDKKFTYTLTYLVETNWETIYKKLVTCHSSKAKAHKLLWSKEIKISNSFFSYYFIVDIMRTKALHNNYKNKKVSTN
jgi:hypothetical protein